MATLRIIEHLDIVEDVLPGVGSGFVSLPSDPLRLEKMKEALRDSIVVTVPTSAHAGHEPVRVEERPPFLARELRSLV